MGARVGRLVAFDREQSRLGKLMLAGVDEAGRGAWAGPVVAAAVVLPPGCALPGLNDSKQLTASRREELFVAILASASSWGACAVSPAIIDHKNILQATMEAMGRSLAKLDPVPDLVLVDGNRVPDCPLQCRAVVRGDATSAAIAAASIVAKVLRDRIMRAYENHFPGYGFAAHKGYGVKGHGLALRTLGPCPIHRMSYRPVAELDQGRLF